MRVINFGVASRLYSCTIPNGCIWAIHITKITTHCMDPTKSFMFLILEWIITLPKWKDYCHLFRKPGPALYMATHILLSKVPASGSTFSIIFLYGESHTPHSSYFVRCEDRSLLIHRKYEACNFSVLPFPKTIWIKKVQKTTEATY